MNNVNDLVFFDLFLKVYIPEILQRILILASQTSLLVCH